MGLRKRKIKVQIPTDAKRKIVNGKAFVKINGYFWPVIQTPKGERAECDSPTFYARYVDENGKRVEVCTGCHDKANAEKFLSDRIAHVERIKLGLVKPEELEQIQKGSMPLTDALEAYMQSLEAKGTTSEYRKNARSAITRILKEIPFHTSNDLDHDKLIQWLSNATDSKGTKLGGRNRNHFRNSMNRFTEFLVSENYRATNPFTKIKPVNEAIGRKTKRRAFTPDELTKLFEVTLSRPLKENQTIRRGANKGTQGGKLRPETTTRLNLLGKERYLIYRTLLYTGLRINELRTLKVARIDLTPTLESIHLEAHNEKTRQGNTIPLRVDLADELREWITETKKEPSDQLFNVTGSYLKVLNLDLEGAGIQKIDQRGGKLDIHSFRKTLNTLLRVQGVHDATVKRMMRHAHEGMTDLYTDDNFLPVRQAVNSLPNIQTSLNCTRYCTHSEDFGGADNGRFW